VASQSGTNNKVIKKIKTYRMDLKTLIWFIAKFDANLRLDIVNFAFSKLEESNKIDIDKAIEIAKKPKVYENGYMSVRGCIGVAFDDIEEPVSESDVWDALVWNGIAVTKAKVTIKRVLSNSMENIIGNSKKNTVVFDPNVVRNAYDKWLKDGKPKPTEYERLKQEFEQIANYYHEMMEKAK